ERRGNRDQRHRGNPSQAVPIFSLMVNKAVSVRRDASRGRPSGQREGGYSRETCAISYPRSEWGAMSRPPVVSSGSSVGPSHTAATSVGAVGELGRVGSSPSQKEPRGPWRSPLGEDLADPPG